MFQYLKQSSMRLLNPVEPLISFGVICAVFICINLNIDKALIIGVLDIYFLFLPNIHASHIIFSEGSGNFTPGMVDMILIQAVYPRYPKYLCHLIRDSLAPSLGTVIVPSDIISFKLDFVFNAGVPINAFCFCIVKDTAYLM